MRIPTSDIFYLIKSLDNREFLFIDKYLSSWNFSAQNQMQILFHYSKKIKSYDEEKVKSALATEIIPTSYHSCKALLYDNILRGLQDFYPSYSSRTKLMIWIRSAEILLNKEMFEDGVNQLLLAKDFAIQQNQLGHAYWIQILLNKYEDKVEFENDCSKAYLLSILDASSSYLDITTFMIMITSLQLSLANFDKEEKKLMQKSINHYRKLSEDSDHVAMQVFFNQGMFIYYKSLHEYLNAYTISTKLIQSIKSHPEWYRYLPEANYTVVGNHLILLLFLDKRKEFDEKISLLDEIQANDTSLEMEIQGMK